MRSLIAMTVFAIAVSGSDLTAKMVEEAAASVARTVALGVNDVLVTPGKPQTIRVALDHINRIATPFSTFDLWTESPEQFQTRGHVFYIAPTDERPITLFVTPKGDESLALRLTLVPSRIPPTEIHLRLADETGALVLPAAVGVAAAAPSEPPLPSSSVPSFESGPYEEAIASVVMEIAAGSVPAGYVAAPMTAVFPRCRQTGGFTIRFDGGQRFVGSPFEVFVGVVTAAGGGRRGFDEQWCAAPDVVAVALWPDSDLAPGERAEIMVLRRRASASPRPSRARPSLIDAGLR